MFFKQSVYVSNIPTDVCIDLFVNVYTYSWSMILKNICYRKRKSPHTYFDIKHIFRNRVYNQMNQSLLNPIQELA